MTRPAQSRQPTDDHRSRLGRGFNWLGGATVIARVVDLSTIVAMLAFLTKQQLGVASLVISIGMVVEAFNGLGTSEALIQARSVSREQLDALFWYVVGAAILVGGLILLAAPAIAAIYGVAGMGGYVLAIAAKQPLVGGALIPLALMSRDLQYERIAVVNVGATLAAAATRLSLGASGAGTWALVAGFAASGVFTLIGAVLARPFLPRLRFRIGAVVPLARFGVHAAAANVAEQMFKNIDYMLIGWFYGAAPLAVYRVAFDIAMEPAMAVGTLVNRTMLPVLARISAARRHLAQKDVAQKDVAQTLAWSLRRIALLVAPLMAAVVLAAHPLTALLHDHDGNSYAAAAGPLRLLAVAALLRVTMLLLTTAMIGIGRPAAAARLSATALLLLGAAILGTGFIVPPNHGLLAVSAAWLAIFPPLLAWCVLTLRSTWIIRPAALAALFAAPLAAIVGLVITVTLATTPIDGAAPLLRLGIVIAATLAAYAALFRYESRNECVAIPISADLITRPLAATADHSGQDRL